MISCFVLLAALVAEPPRSAETPELAGESLPRAAQLLTLRGLHMAEGVYFISPENWRADIEPRTVYLQFPRARAAVADGGTVAVWRFEQATPQQAKREVPDLVGKTWQAAVSELDASEWPLMNPRSAANENDIVTDQYPKAGSKVYAGTSILLKTAPADTIEDR